MLLDIFKWRKNQWFWESIDKNGRKKVKKPLKFNKEGKAKYFLDKNELNEAYILFDYCEFVFDGGYYYRVDLLTYGKGKK